MQLLLDEAKISSKEKFDISENTRICKDRYHFLVRAVNMKRPPAAGWLSLA